MPSCSARSPTGSRASCRSCTAPRVLELGCGTGLFSRHLLGALSRRKLRLDRCCAGHDRANAGAILRRSSTARISFEVMDAGEAGGHADLDLIASSMALHWLADPVASLERLRRLLAPGGVLLYATLGPESFAEWRARACARRLAERARRDPAASRHRRRGAPGARRRRARLPAPHEGGRRPHAEGGLRAVVARRAPPRHPRRRREASAAASPGTSSMARSARSTRAQSSPSISPA